MGNEAPPLDPARIQELQTAFGDTWKVLLERLVETYSRRAPEMLKALEAARAAGDSAGVVQHAHALKGLAGNLGVRHVQALAANIEGRGRAAELDGLEGPVGELHEHYETGLDALQELVGG